MEFHALESTKGQRYAEMGRFLTPEGEQTSDEAAAAKTPDGRPAVYLDTTRIPQADAEISLPYMLRRYRGAIAVGLGTVLLSNAVGMVSLEFVKAGVDALERPGATRSAWTCWRSRRTRSAAPKASAHWPEVRSPAGSSLIGKRPLVARSTGHFSLVAAAPLAIFLLILMRADGHERDAKRRDDFRGQPARPR